jgi:glycosyltransferase involved in cell wall biosynthesis
MAHSETVSIVIPTYYRNEALVETLESVFEQQYRPLEVVVVDDSGEAHAAPVAADHDSVTYLPLEENSGPFAAREVGVRETSGRYVQLLDDDDRLLPGKFEAQIPILRSDPGVGVVYCGLQWEDGPSVLPDPAVRGDVLEDALQFSTAPAMIGTILTKRDLLEDILPFPNRHGADDIGMKIELAQRTEFDFVDEVLLIRGNSSESVGTSWGAIEGRHEILATYADLYAEYPAAYRKALAETYLVSGQFHLTERGWSTAAIADFVRAVYYAPGIPPVYLGSLIAALFGRRVYQRVRSIYSSVVLGDSRSGKVT